MMNKWSVGNSTPTAAAPVPPLGRPATSSTTHQGIASVLPLAATSASTRSATGGRGAVVSAMRVRSAATRRHFGASVQSFAASFSSFSSRKERAAQQAQGKDNQGNTKNERGFAVSKCQDTGITGHRSGLSEVVAGGVEG